MLTFSIVMPTYRRPHTLPRAVASVLAQTYPHWDLLLVNNDAGPLADLPGDPRIRVVHHPEQTGASDARNMGLGYATGDVVCFFDDDDEAAPTWLQRFAETFAANPAAKAVRCGLILPDGREFRANATPCVALRREYAAPTWEGHRWDHDQHYFGAIFARHRWTQGAGVIDIPDVLVRAHRDLRGGLRAGKL